MPIKMTPNIKRADYKRAWVAKNVEKVKAYHKAWWARNKAKQKIKRAAYFAHPKRKIIACARTKAWRLAKRLASKM